MKSGSNLEKVLEAGHFAFTGELGPPRGTSAKEVKEKAQYLKGNVDSVNITDNQTAVVRMSSWAACLLLIQEGLEPNFQMVCRDRNRLAMQADILGGYTHGIRNMLCLSGDHCMFGDHPDAMGVFDIDSMQLINMVKTMRDEGKFQSGTDIQDPPKIFIGAAANPFAEPYEWRVHRLAKKINAGVDFIQTQCIYNMDRFRKWMQKKVPGIEVPETLIDRLKGVEKKKVADEGIKIACEQIEEFKELKGVHGVHLMAIEWEHKVPEIAELAKVLPRPKV